MQEKSNAVNKLIRGILFSCNCYVKDKKCIEIYKEEDER